MNKRARARPCVCMCVRMHVIPPSLYYTILTGEPLPFEVRSTKHRTNIGSGTIDFRFRRCHDMKAGGATTGGLDCEKKDQHGGQQTNERTATLRA